MEAVMQGLREAHALPEEARRVPWPGWDRDYGPGNPVYTEMMEHFPEVLAEGLRTEEAAPLQVRWEGSQFVYHSLAHINRQLCLRPIRRRPKPWDAREGPMRWNSWGGIAQRTSSWTASKDSLPAFRCDSFRL